MISNRAHSSLVDWVFITWYYVVDNSFLSLIGHDKQVVILLLAAKLWVRSTGFTARLRSMWILPKATDRFHLFMKLPYWSHGPTGCLFVRSSDSHGRFWRLLEVIEFVEALLSYSIHHLLVVSDRWILIGWVLFVQVGLDSFAWHVLRNQALDLELCRVHNGCCCLVVWISVFRSF